MVILSYEFALAFLLFFCVYWYCRDSIKLQNYLLIGAGLLFIASYNWKFVLSVLVMWQITQISALVIHLSDKHKVKKLSLIGALSALVAHLAFFKYSNFFIEQVNGLGAELTPLDIILPIGVSFYTFQAISYLVDVYQEKVDPLPSAFVLGIFTFVPTFTAGPIFRVKNAVHQWLPDTPAIDDKHRETETKMNTIDPKTQTRSVLMPYLAGTLIIFALAKKMVFASWLGEIWVTPVFNNPLQFNGLEVLTAVYAYSWQLFFDFSGYTDLAIALALLLGFRIPENFQQPYLATDIQDFWNRWHISLSHWIRDYLYIPLGGNRCPWWRVQVNVMLAFTISGIWHGAGWNFFIWGAIHGIALVWLNVMRKKGHRHKLTRFSPRLANFITFNYVSFAWIFFHSKSYEQATDMIKGLFNFHGAMITLPLFITLLAMIATWLIYPKLEHSRHFVARQLQRLPWVVLPVVITGYILLILAISPSGLPAFIYSNF